MPQNNKDKPSIGEQLQSMSKEELLILIKNVPFLVRQPHIDQARARGLRRKAEYALWQYKQIDLQIPDGKADHRFWSEYHKQAALKDALWNKYERYWEKADKIEFGEE